MAGLLAPAASPAVLGANQADCDDAACALITSDYYLYEAIRRLDGQFPPGVITP